MTVRRAAASDAPELTRIINAAFNPAEAFFVEGDRITQDQVRAFLEKGIFLITDDAGACVYIELRGERAYFGLLSVDPPSQGRGLAKQLISAAENLAIEQGCRFMDIRVVNLREELPPYYRKLGYGVTGTEPFTKGSPTKVPCHFICMAKRLERIS
jgi:GNAT superfamily N-acetyltransferase